MINIRSKTMTLITILFCYFLISNSYAQNEITTLGNTRIIQPGQMANQNNLNNANSNQSPVLDACFYNPSLPECSQSNNQNQQENTTNNSAPQKQKSSLTAAEQGFYDQEEEIDYQQLIENYKRNNSARQKGYKINVLQTDGMLKNKPAKYIGGKLNSAYSLWQKNQTIFNQWSHMLKKIGVPSEKITFEAKRLSVNDFEDWSWRQCLLSEALNRNSCNQ